MYFYYYYYYYYCHSYGMTAQFRVLVSSVFLLHIFWPNDSPCHSAVSGYRGCPPVLWLPCRSTAILFFLSEIFLGVLDLSVLQMCPARST